LGISISFFLFVQVILGMLMSAGKLASLDASPAYSLLYAIHAGWNPLGSVYRLLLGLAACVQVSLGIAIFFGRLRSGTGGATVSTVPPTPDRQHGLQKEASMGALSFAADIRPLFRERDVKGMKPNGIDLSSYEDVKSRIKDIYGRLSAGDMPCDGPWDESTVRKLKMWIDTGMAP
jgi:hypothetical protein